MLKSRRAIEAVISDWPIKILSLAAAVVLLLFYRIGSLQERFFSVPLRVEVAEGFVPVGDVTTSVRVNLRGVEEEIFLVLEQDIEAYVDLTGHTAEGLFREPVMIRKSGSAETIEVEITVEPLETTVALEAKVSRNVDVVPQIKGFPDRGFELVQYSVTPSTIEVEGPRSYLENLVNLETEDIDLSGRRESFTIRVRAPIIDATIKPVVGDVVDFHGIIAEIRQERTFEAIEIVVINLGEDLRITSEVSVGSVRVESSQLRLEEVTPGQLQIQLDCREIIEPGNYLVGTQTIVPEGLIVRSFSPVELELIVEATTVQES